MFGDIKRKFKKLSASEKEELLQDIYNFSRDMRLFLENRLGENQGQEFIEKMRKETIGKVFKAGVPGTPNGRTINSIIAKAKKSKVNSATLLILEKLAYRGFVEFLNEFGGGPESFEEMASKHFKEYLSLIKSTIANGPEQNRTYCEIREYLLKKNNMYTDELDEIFEEITSMKIER